MTEVTDEQLLSVYLSGMGAGAGTLACALDGGRTSDRAKAQAADIVKHAHDALQRDPAFRFELQEAIRRIISGDTAPGGSGRWVRS